VKLMPSKSVALTTDVSVFQLKRDELF